MATAPKYAFPKFVKELRFQICQTGNKSLGARKFLKNSYSVMKECNPNIHILIREASGITARAIARFEFGREEEVSLEGLTDEECAKQVENLIQLQPEVKRHT